MCARHLRRMCGRGIAGGDDVMARVPDFMTYKRTRQIVERLPVWNPPDDYDRCVKDARELEDALRRFCEDKPSDTE